MLTETVQFNIPAENHVIGFRFKDGVVDNGVQVASVAGSKEGPGFSHALRCFQKTFPIGILSDFQKQFPCKPSYIFFIH